MKRNFNVRTKTPPIVLNNVRIGRHNDKRAQLCVDKAWKAELCCYYHFGDLLRSFSCTLSTAQVRGSEITNVHGVQKLPWPETIKPFRRNFFIIFFGLQIQREVSFGLKILPVPKRDILWPKLVFQVIPNLKQRLVEQIFARKGDVASYPLDT